jgi:Cu(I)/Ag(I) efflux system membrane fusion protein
VKTLLKYAFLGFFLLAGCHSKPEEHSTTGVVNAVEAGGKGINITHEAFPNFMEGMTMTFPTGDPALAQGLKKGDKIRFTIARQGDDWLITKVEKLDK